MEASQTGPTGVPAVCPAVPARRNDSDSVTIPCLPTGGDTVRAPTSTREAARESLVQVNVHGELLNAEYTFSKCMASSSTEYQYQ